MKLVKFISLILAVSLFANPVLCNDTPEADSFTVSEAVHHQNVDILKDYIIKFHARGGAYIVLNTDTDEQVDKQFVEMNEGFQIWSHNALRLFNYAVGFHSGTIKDNGKIILNVRDSKLFDHVTNADREAYFRPYIIKEHAMPMSLLFMYVRLFKNTDNYLSESQLAALKSAVSDNVKTGKAKSANVEKYDVSGITSTTDKTDDGKAVYTTFVGEFVANGKNYAIITVLNEPEALKSTYGFNSSGWNAAPLAAEIIKNIGDNYKE